MCAWAEIAKGWQVTPPAGQVLSLRGIGHALAEEKQRAIRPGIGLLEERHAYVLCNAVGGDHIPQVDREKSTKRILMRLLTSVAWRTGRG
jgi:hypothetical protein